MITYNHEKYIRQALESVFAQICDFNFEIVIGEDLSTDGTRAIIREFEAKYPSKIKPIYHETNVGMMRNAFEYCIPRCSGKYIAVLEGDDYWTDVEKLRKQVQFLESNQAYSFCYHTFDVVNERDPNLDLSYLKQKNIPPPGNTCELPYYIRNKSVKTLTLMYRANAILAAEIKHVLLDSPRPASGDIPLVMLLLTKGPGYLINEKMGVYRLHGAGMTVNQSEEWQKRVDPVLLTSIKLYKGIRDRATRSFVRTKLKSALNENIYAREYKLAFRIARALAGI